MEKKPVKKTIKDKPKSELKEQKPRSKKEAPEKPAKKTASAAPKSKVKKEEPGSYFLN